MNWFGTFLTSSIGKKFVMGLTGISLVLFLLVHCGINALIFANDGGVLFNKAAHFMGTNIIIRTMEIGLFGGILLHIVQAYILAAGNAKARPSKYQVNNASANSRWYSRSMTLLGTLILLFLIIHLKHFWVVSRFIGLEETDYGAENLFIEMQKVFAGMAPGTRISIGISDAGPEPAKVQSTDSQRGLGVFNDYFVAVRIDAGGNVFRMGKIRAYGTGR
jgi:succinate dehydrogenase / fumarate reductase, cytochrome b subunit